jgi:hypothetical protein
VRHPAPEILERGFGALKAASRMAVRQHGGVHRAGGRARNTLNAQPRFFEQAIEHTPCERAVSAAALQREVD